MHINLAYLLFTLWSVAHAAPASPSEQINLEHYSSRKKPISSSDPPEVHVKLESQLPPHKQIPTPDLESKLETIFKKWIRNMKIFEIEKKKAEEGKEATAINDLPDIQLVPLKIVIEPGSAKVLQNIKFWGPGVKIIPGVGKGCENEGDQCWGSVFNTVAFFHTPDADVSYVNVEDGYGVGVKKHRSERAP
ncbi:hypothetical protein F5876DRAFT_74589 [Lentinula aff. lateritia]|uniref:Uncharacterized protein n=1 Tax=Lentinula aff. lateritia TaxID=2804960 RepID=A0ACC1U6J6_9AGAR|nr:hypothetical protein F5876DRAFT_74589 [Lentinula aff. lateritia]